MAKNTILETILLMKGIEKVSIDLDGVLAYYSGWKGAEHIGAPIPEGFELVEELYVIGYELLLSTVRLNPYATGIMDPFVVNGGALEVVQDWLEKHNIFHCFSVVTG